MVTPLASSTVLVAVFLVSWVVVVMSITPPPS